jgi:hypothetical protein
MARTTGRVSVFDRWQQASHARLFCLCNPPHVFFNDTGNVSQVISSFDDDIGFVAGLPVGTQTIAHAFKAYGRAAGRPYTALYSGKWGIGVRFLCFERQALWWWWWCVELTVCCSTPSPVCLPRNRERHGPIHPSAWGLTISGTHRTSRSRVDQCSSHIGPLSRCSLSAL